jgi:RNA polymerase sigma-70 factor (ECF subfamily)
VLSAGSPGAVSSATVGSVDARIPGEIADAGPAERRLDPDSAAWLTSLRAGEGRDEAIGRLHALLLRAARFEVGRRRAALRHLRGNELEDIALEAADDATMAVLAHLDDFRGLSRFTTWAYKFALLEAAVKLRRRAWQGREIPMEPESWNAFAAGGLSPEDRAEQTELLGALQRAVATVLTPHQRRVLTALALNDVPIDVLAERLGTTRGALYKTLHDARRRLREHLRSAGLSPSLTREDRT